MSLDGTLVLTQYVPYKWDQNLNLKDSDFTVPASNRDTLETLKKYGVHLQFDNSKSQGLNILSKTGARLGNVKVFLNDNWLAELMRDLQKLADDPAKYGLA